MYQFVGASETSKRLTSAIIGGQWFIYWSSDVWSLRCMKGTFIYQSDHTAQLAGHPPCKSDPPKLQHCWIVILAADHSDVWMYPTSDVWRVHSYIRALMLEHVFQRICTIMRSRQKLPYWKHKYKSPFNCHKAVSNNLFAIIDSVLKFVIFVNEYCVFLTAFGCTQHPKAGRNTQQMSIQ